VKHVTRLERGESFPEQLKIERAAAQHVIRALRNFGRDETVLRLARQQLDGVGPLELVSGMIHVIRSTLP
jgi:putative IMPACT (imprinted ancient) family translation regulator